MDDSFLHRARRDPAPEFARRLRAALHESEQTTHRSRGREQVLKWVSAAASVAIVSVAFTFPAVRAGAQAFLDLFRVVNFAGVSFDPSRITDLRSRGLDLQSLIGDSVEVLEDPGPPVAFESTADASAASGMTFRAPAWLPPGWQQQRVEVGGERAARVTTSTAKLQSVLDALGIDDLSAPTELDGQQVTLRIHPTAVISYANGSRTLRFVQAASPDVSFPQGLELSTLAEIGLRILGLDRDDAYRFAQSFDWRSTLLVPVPATAASFREVDVGASRGLMIETVGSSNVPSESALFWANDGRVFALEGGVRAPELLEMAQTVQ
jgi:hypothetical protein